MRDSTYIKELCHAMELGGRSTFCNIQLGTATFKFSDKFEDISCPKCREIMRGNTIDDVHHPKHYAANPDGIECIQVTRWFNFNLGNAIKYIWRAGKKTTDPVQDLQKAIKYLEFEIERIKQYGNQS